MSTLPSAHPVTVRSGSLLAPYRVPAGPLGKAATKTAPPVDWSWVALLAVIYALGFVGIPMLVDELALEAHSVLPEVFVGWGVLAGGALALLFGRVAEPADR